MTTTVTGYTITTNTISDGVTCRIDLERHPDNQIINGAVNIDDIPDDIRLALYDWVTDNGRTHPTR